MATVREMQRLGGSFDRLQRVLLNRALMKERKEEMRRQEVNQTRDRAVNAMMEAEARKARGPQIDARMVTPGGASISMSGYAKELEPTFRMMLGDDYKAQMMTPPARPAPAPGDPERPVTVTEELEGGMKVNRRLTEEAYRQMVETLSQRKEDKTADEIQNKMKANPKAVEQLDRLKALKSAGVKRVRSVGQSPYFEPDTWYTEGEPIDDVIKTIQDAALFTMDDVTGGKRPTQPGTPAAAPTPAPAQPSGGPQPGAVVDGYRFKGGDPNIESNWVPAKP